MKEEKESVSVQELREFFSDYWVEYHEDSGSLDELILYPENANL